MSKMLKSSGAMAIATLASRLFGMVREMAYTRFMGDGWVAGAFQVAFTVPNLFRRLLGEGALTAAFIPIFKEKEKTAGEIEMWRAGNAVISGLIVAAAIVIAIVLAGISIALNVHQFSAKADLMLRLLQVMFPYMLFVCLAAVFMGMLNARGYFFIPAMGATVLNVVLIGTVLFVAPNHGDELREQVFAVAWAVLLAGLAQALFQLPSLWRDGFRFHWVPPWRNETVRRVVKQMIPGAVGVAAFQINVALIQGLGLWLDTPERPLIAPFNYAVRLMELPQGVFGISLATFLLPTLAGLAVEKNYGEFRSTLRQGISHLVLINLLMSVLLIVLAEPIIRLLFEGGKFGPDSTARAAFALECLGPSLVAYSLVNIFARAFYALGDTRTPMNISIACLVLNLVFSVALVGWLRQGGLGIANTISSACNAALLIYALRRKLGKLELGVLRPTVLPMLVAAGAAALAAGWIRHLWQSNFADSTVAEKLGAVFVPAIAAAGLYWGIVLALGVPAAREITGLLLRRRRSSR